MSAAKVDEWDPIDEPLTYYSVDFDSKDYTSNRHRVAAMSDANALSSELNDDSGEHLFMVDIDLPCKLIPSSTPGHHHLYVNRRMTWQQFGNILAALADAGVVEPGYVDACEKRQAAFLRLPWIQKGDDR